MDNLKYYFLTLDEVKGKKAVIVPAPACLPPS
jgi:hypothetical protein